MAKYKKVKIEPLTEIEKLNLKKGSEKHYDATDLPAEKQKELLSKLMDIARQSEGAIVAKPVSGKQYVAATVRTTKQKGKTFAFPEPNPIHAYYKIAIQHLEQAETFQTQFHDAVNGHPEQEYETFCNFFEEIVQGIVFLLMTVEGFINQLPNEDQVYQINGNERTKSDIEWMNVTDKLRLALPALTGNNIFVTNKPMYDHLQLLNDLRNDLIHLKKLELANFTYYQGLFKRLLDFPSGDIANAVFDFINIINPNFLVEENQP